MRIIGGAFRGRRLAAVGKGDEAAKLRPTGDRVRESLFNILMARFAERVIGSRALDLFAGTGALGLEAISRGADSVTFIENSRKSLKILKQNVIICDADDRAHIIARDVFQVDDLIRAPFDLVFLDPPYGKGLGEAALEHALSKGWLASNALVVWEEGSDVVVPSKLDLIETRKYGDTHVTLAQKA